MRHSFLGWLVWVQTALLAFDASIPVLHLPDFYEESTRDAFVDKLEAALRDVGFFALTGTGFNASELSAMYAEIEAFFDHPLDLKRQLITQDGQRGYLEGESAKGDSRIDSKEFYHIGRDITDPTIHQLGRFCNVWPSFRPSFKPAMLELFDQLDTFKNNVGEMIAAAMQCPSDFINNMTLNGDCLLRVIHYPSNTPEGAIWAAAHTDINFFTILPKATAKGLQIYNNEKWIEVTVPDDAVLINGGDMLENLTNGYFKSSLHRVLDPGLSQRRYSAVFFVHPSAHDSLAPLPAFIDKTGGVAKFASVVRLELLAERLIDLGVASRELMAFFVQSGAIERLQVVGRLSPKAEQALIDAGFDI